MTQAANIIAFPRPAVHQSARWDRGGEVIALPLPPRPVWSRADRLAIRGAARAFEGIVDGLRMSDIAMKDEVRRHLRELRLVRDPLRQLVRTIAELDLAAKLLNHRRHMTMSLDDFLDVLDEAAETLHALIARPSDTGAAL